MKPFSNPAVKAKFDSYPAKVRRKMLALRELVFRTASSTPSVGEIQETLKWGEPAYVTVNGAGSYGAHRLEGEEPTAIRDVLSLSNESGGNVSNDVSEGLPVRREQGIGIGCRAEDTERRIDGLYCGVTDLSSIKAYRNAAQAASNKSINRKS